MSKITQSSAIKRQIPEHIRDNYPLFVDFLKAYYEFLQQTQAQNLEEIKSIDLTLEEFIDKFKLELSSSVPVDLAQDKRMLLKHLREFYLSRGSEASFKFLFRTLFDKEAELYYPSTQVLRVSDGKWNQDVSIFVRMTSETTSLFPLNGNFINIQYGSQYIQTYVENVIQYAGDIYEIFIQRNFLTQIEIGAEISATIDNATYEGVILKCPSKVSVYKKGSGFKPGDVFALRTSLGPGCIVKVTKTDSTGGILAVQIIRFGLDYESTFWSYLSNKELEAIPYNTPASTVTVQGTYAYQFDSLDLTTSGTSGSIKALTYGNGLYVYATNSGGLRTSTDAITWTARTSGTTSSILSLTHGNGLYVYAGNGGELRTSTDGITWTARTSGTTSNINTLVYSNGLYVYAGFGGVLATSTDAITWTARTSGTTSNINALAYGNGLYVYAGNGGELRTSTDGITWSAKISGTAFAINALAYGNGKFLWGGLLGQFASGTQISSSIPTQIKVTKANHGYSAGDTVKLQFYTGSGPATGDYIVRSVSSPNDFWVDSPTPLTSSASNSSGIALLFVPPDSGFEERSAGFIESGFATKQTYMYYDSTIPVGSASNSSDRYYVDGSYVGDIVTSFHQEQNEKSVLDEDLAIIQVDLGAVAKYSGYYLAQDGFISDSIYIQDGKYYQSFSYVIKVEEELRKYVDLVKSILHPAGMKMFAEYSILNEFEVSLTSSFAFSSITQSDLLQFITDSGVNYDDYISSIDANGNIIVTPAPGATPVLSASGVQAKIVTKNLLVDSVNFLVAKYYEYAKNISDFQSTSSFPAKQFLQNHLEDILNSDSDDYELNKRIVDIILNTEITSSNFKTFETTMQESFELSDIATIAQGFTLKSNVTTIQSIITDFVIEQVITDFVSQTETVSKDFSRSLASLLPTQSDLLSNGLNISKSDNQSLTGDGRMYMNAYSSETYFGQFTTYQDPVASIS